MKEWDRIIVEAYGEASFDACSLLANELESLNYVGSGKIFRPDGETPYWRLTFDRPIEENLIVTTEELFVGGTTPTYFGGHDD